MVRTTPMSGGGGKVVRELQEFRSCRIFGAVGFARKLGKKIPSRGLDFRVRFLPKNAS